MELIEGVNAKYCTGEFCKEENEKGLLKHFNEFHKTKKNKYGLAHQCKKCRNYKKRLWDEKNKEHRRIYNEQWYKSNKDKKLDYCKQWYEENREYKLQKNREGVKKWRENNPDKVREHDNRKRARKNKALGSFTEKEFKELTLEFFGYKCAYTDEPILEDLSNCHREHIVPLSKGGDNGIWNIVPSLDWVNQSKNNSNMEEWYRKQPYFSEKRLHKIYEYMNLMEEIYLEDEVS